MRCVRRCCVERRSKAPSCARKGQAALPCGKRRRRMRNVPETCGELLKQDKCSTSPTVSLSTVCSYLRWPCATVCEPSLAALPDAWAAICQTFRLWQRRGGPANLLFRGPCQLTLPAKQDALVIARSVPESTVKGSSTWSPWAKLHRAKS